MATALNHRQVFLALAFVLVSAAGTLLLASWYLSVSPRFLLAESVNRLAPTATLPGWLQATDPYPGHHLDGALQPGRPRLLSPPEDTPGNAADQTCRSQRVAPRLFCWLLTGDRQSAELALARMAADPSATLRAPDTVWEWALAMDWLATLPSKDPQQWRAARERTRQMILASLARLDDQRLSLWHGRASEAANSWLLAVSIATGEPEERELLRRSQAHFDRVISALAITESWPGGYNYWINSRAMPVVLALVTYRNSLAGSARSTQVDNLLLRLGLWMIHVVRPDNRVQGYADEGPRLDLRDETARVIDLLARHTRHPALASYSAYLRELHGDAAYYRGYRWSRRLFHDPSVPLLPDTGIGGLGVFNGRLPTAELFGPGAANVLYARSDWGPAATFVSFRAGHNFSHHGHYDAGHFTIYKAGPLAVNGSAYGPTHSSHRLQYSVQTIAKNSLLLPGRRADLVTRLRGQASASGGQRLTLPEGSRVRDPAHWRHLLDSGPHLAAGKLLAYHHAPGAYAYIRAELGGAYWVDPGERRVTRDFLYLMNEDIVVVHDALAQVPATVRPAWLLHTSQRPEVASLQRQQGSETAGVFAGIADRARVLAGGGSMDTRIHLPAAAMLTLVGGPGFEWATPGPDGKFVNRSEGRRDMAGYDPAGWRMEVRPLTNGDTHFLIAMLPSLQAHRDGETAMPARQPRGGHTLSTPQRLLVFMDDEQLTAPLALDGSHSELLLLGADASTRIELTGPDGSALEGTYANGAVSFDLRAQSGSWHLRAVTPSG